MIYLTSVLNVVAPRNIEMSMGDISYVSRECRCTEKDLNIGGWLYTPSTSVVSVIAPRKIEMSVGDISYVSRECLCTE